MIEFAQMFGVVVFWLLVGHALCDIPLQGHYMAGLKRRDHADGANHRWVVGLSFHSIIHAGSVAAVTGSVVLGMAEFIAHAAIDFGKCEGRYGMKVDQAAHIACKFLWAALALAFNPEGLFHVGR